MKKVLFTLFVCFGFLAGSFAQAPVASFSATPTTLCAGGNVSWTNLSTFGNNASFAWSFPGGVNPTSTSQNPGPRNYSTPGIYNVTLIVTDVNGTDTLVLTNYIHVLSSPTVTVTPSPAFICVSGSVTLTASGASSYVWSPSTGLNTTTGSTVIATLSASTNYTVVGTNSNGCTRGTAFSVSVNSTAPPQPGGVTGPTTVCSGQSGLIYTVPGVNPPVPLRTWTVPAGATITAGQGTRSVTVTFGSTSGNVCCNASNACGSSADTCLAVTVNPTPSVGPVSTITGPSSVCANQTGVTYFIPPVANAATYTWTVSGGGNSITAGQGTPTITVTFGTNNSNICVTAANSCNTSTPVCKAVAVSQNPPGIPGPITGPTTVCNGQLGVAYSVPTVAGATTYSWTVPAGASVATGQGTRNITIDFGANSGSVCVTAGNACGTSSANCQNITVDPTPALGTVGPISGPSSVCANQTGITYSIPTVPNAATYTWTVSGAGNSITAGQGTNTITVTFGTNNSNICVSASNSCNTSTPICQAVSISATAPGIPGPITGPTTVCNGQLGVAYSVPTVAGATTYSWTVPSGSNVATGQGTRNITINFGATSGSVCVTASNVCGTSASNCQNISVDPNPAVGTVGTITGPTAACANQAGNVYTVPAVTGASTYSWTVPGGASVTAGQGTNTITVTFGGTAGNVCVTASNSCSSSSPSCIAVSISANAPGIPGPMTGPTTVCNGQTGVAYSVPTVAGATSYSWTVPAGASVATGQGTRNVTIDFGANSGSVCVTASNVCGTSSANCQNVTVDPNSAVGTVGAIYGPSAVCANQTGINYSVPAVTGASTYSWTVSGAGNSITAGQGTNTITVTFGTNNSNICVTASNSCSSSSQKCMAVTIDPNAPGIPGAITGPTTVCNGSLGINYSISSVANASAYSWSVPSGANITAGQGTTAITVTFGATSGTVCVTASNSCGTSAPNCVAVTVDPTPAVGPVGTITGPTSACSNQVNVVYSIGSVTNATSYNWTVPSLANITAGQGTQTITVSFGNVSGNVCVDASNSCGSSAPSCIAVTISPSAPAIPGAITGASVVCNSQSGVNYSVASVLNATVYSWTVPAGATITSGQGTNAITVNFGSTSGNICVTAGNACGTSASSCQAITVNSSALIVPAPTTSPATCSSCCDGSATATPSGGTAPYTYIWNSSPAQATATATGLCASTSYSVCVTDAMGCVTCSSVSIPFTTGISYLTDNGSIILFPNPANEYLFIQGIVSSSAKLQVSIVNILGEKIIDKSVYASGSFQEKINIVELTSGVYFVDVRSGDMVKKLKFIKVP